MKWNIANDFIPAQYYKAKFPVTWKLIKNSNITYISSVSILRLSSPICDSI